MDTPALWVDGVEPDVGCVIMTSACDEDADVFNGMLVCNVVVLVVVDSTNDNGSAAAAAISTKTITKYAKIEERLKQ